MQLQTTYTESYPRLSSPARCPQCGDAMVAALASEFVDSEKIRHHWTCDNCGQNFSTTIMIQD